MASRCAGFVATALLAITYIAALPASVVMASVSALLGARLLEGDCLAHIGGEEFMLVLRQCDAGRGRRVAESVRHNVAASLGVAQWAADESFEAAVERADRAPYDAKHGGRDRVDDSDARRITTIPMDLPPSGPLH